MNRKELTLTCQLFAYEFKSSREGDKPLETFFVILMTADPKPGNRVSFQRIQCPIIESDSD